MKNHIIKRSYFLSKTSIKLYLEISAFTKEFSEGMVYVTLLELLNDLYIESTNNITT